MQKPTPALLSQAHAAARLRGTLADAMRSPVLARCLEITALALSQPRADRYRPPPAAPPAIAARTAHNDQFAPPRRDYKRASAADTED
ncbi:hypothetical protein [Achromobacter mucicolens]|uniref:hypothetical protein n=1 Tax=Achromobacter mucicolens TaxID=1389922 RepID=UPI0039749AE2